MTAPGSARRETPRADLSAKRRAVGAVAAVGVIAALGAGLTGCANGATGLVDQACHHVEVSLVLYRESVRATDPTVAAADLARAQGQLQDASPLAAQAAGQAPQWQALMATLAENSRLPESDLVQALQDQCAAAQNGGTTGPSLPVTTLPPPPRGSSGS
jgi:hypothetical protein